MMASMDMHVSTPWPWTVILPIKGGSQAKTRLWALGARRVLVAAAVAADTITAVAASSRVARILVVTADDRVRLMAEGFGAQVVADPGTGLDDAVGAALRLSPAHRPCAVLLADVPAVRPGDVALALDACAAAFADGAVRALVPDTDGSGTVLLAAAYPAAVRPQFGPGSALRHAGDGAAVLEVELPRLRRDVDTPEDLAAAIDLGVGTATAHAVTCCA